MADPVSVYPPSPSIEPIKAVGQVLMSELSLTAGQIMLGLENWVVPKDRGMYIALFYGTEEVVGNNNGVDVDSAGNFVEVQESVMLHHIDLDVMSFDSSARTGKEKVLWALGSQAAQAAMEKYGMRFATTPSSFVPVPSLETTKWLNRFRSTFAVNALHRNSKIVPYYDSLATPKLVINP
jgi:hypothetical protein